GDFLATDRKLAEHLDLAYYLGKDKNELLRGEFTGDVNHDKHPILFGLWSVESEDDLLVKLSLLQEGAKRLLEKGIHEDKKLGFYQTTYNHYKKDINTDMSTTIGNFAKLSKNELLKYTRITDKDDELGDFLIFRD
ncbi:MAG: hypothetical protein PQJ46_02840, partial [Spirochaetales bacterium]|nr:hypothetical protein [Spirochaetales bacterium]